MNIAESENNNEMKLNEVKWAGHIHRQDKIDKTRK